MHLTTEQKLDSLLDFCDKLSYEQRIVFSNEGNLTARHKVLGVVQPVRSEKPKGLWYSFGRAWTEFLFDDTESWSTQRLIQITHIYELDLDFKKVCEVCNKKDFDDFEDKVSIRNKSYINWSKVSRHWSGIDVRYCRDKAIYGDDWSPWYNDWDVSSGCIWNRDAIRSIKLLKSWTPFWLEEQHES